MLLEAGSSKGPRSPQVFTSLDDLPEIRDFVDLQRFWDAVLGRFLLIQRPLIPALTSALQFIDMMDALVSLGILPPSEAWEWNMNEGLRYLARYLYSTKQPEGDLSSVSQYDIDLAGETVRRLGELSFIRDHIENVRLSLGSVAIDTTLHLIEFSDSPEVVADVSRRELQSRRERLESGRIARVIALQEGVRETEQRITTALEEPLSVMGSSQAEKALVALMMDRSTTFAPAPVSQWMPDTFDLGCYSAGDYRKMCAYLAAVGRMHQALVGRLLEARSVLPHQMPLVVVDREFVVAQAAGITGVLAERASNLVRDFTYAGDGLSTPFDQPLLPIGAGRYMTITRLLLAPQEWVGSLLRTLERLPWRRDARDRFGAARESLMQDVLERGILGLPAQTRRNVQVGPKSARVGDLDLVVFRDDEHTALALSLKWFYPPSLVQEVASQAARIRDAIERHRQVVQAAQHDLPRLATVHRLPRDLEFCPAVVIQPGPVFERVRHLGIPVVTGDRFLEVVAHSSGLKQVADLLWEETVEPPSLRIVGGERTIWLGKYRFKVPKYYIPKSERDQIDADTE